MKIKYLKQFRKDILKLDGAKKEQFKKRIEFFQLNQNHPLLNNHELKGSLKGRYTINITGDMRAMYRILSQREDELIIEFIRLGSHSQLYR